jgi:tRNA-specific 2-thiouridylase
LGAGAVATGHYARVEHDETTGRFLLKRGMDSSKDQAYFLFSLTQAQLARACFPVGGLAKQDVREYARRNRLPVADKPDSQELCFVPDGDYAAFVAERSTDVTRSGAIVDERGQVLGGHDGIHHFTVGQRKGLGLQTAGAARAPLYVLSLDADRREVMVGPRGSLERTSLTVSGVNWVAAEPNEPIKASVQIRHRHKAANARVRCVDHTRAIVEFEEPQVAITPGQAAVFYDEDVVVGGGWID